MRKQAICYYVSGHGLGHASRAAQVMACLPPETTLIVRSLAPEPFFRMEVPRPFLLRPEAFDCGVWQKSNVELDWARTFKEAVRVQRQSEERSDAEIRFLRRSNVAAVVCDVPGPPLRIAREAGIPGFAVCNFTWIEIYRRVAGNYPGGMELLESYRHDYSCATLAFRTPMTFPMNYFPAIRDIPLIARRGKRRRRELMKELGIPRNDRLVLVYVGTWSDGDDRLQCLGEMRGVTFLGFPPIGPPVQVLDRNRWSFHDIVASVDAVLAKPGYGTVGECMACGTPVIYYPRPEFAEYGRMRQAIVQWGGGVRIAGHELTRWRLGAALEKAFAIDPPRVDCSGARVTARTILRHLDHNA